MLALTPLLLFAACSETTRSSPSPEAIETAESLSRDVTISAPSGTARTTDTDDGSVMLRGRIFGGGMTGVILAHMRPADQTAWFPYATELAKQVPGESPEEKKHHDGTSG